MNRRDLLKFFGAGATIVPVLGGLPQASTPVKLIEEAKFEPVEIKPARFEINRLRDYRVKTRMTVEISYADGIIQRFSADTFITNVTCVNKYINSVNSIGPCGIAAGALGMEWTLNGRAIPDGNGVLICLDNYD